MAGGGEGEVSQWKKIKEEMTCSICGDLFTEPKTIPCLHTFCKICLEKSIEMDKRLDRDVSCPLCRAKFFQDDVDLIPSNFTTNHLVEIYVQRRKPVVSHIPIVSTSGDVSSDSSGNFSETQTSENEHKSKTLYTAKYNYLPRGENELALKEGDLFYILNNEDPNWWLGQNKEVSSQVGYIPSSYVAEYRENQSTLSQNQVEEKRKNNTDTLNGKLLQLNERAASNKSREETNKPGMRNYQLFIAKHNYLSRIDDDLSIRKGDLFYIIDADDDGWWLARSKYSGKEGYIPSSYVKEYKSALDVEDWYFGAITKNHADKLLMQPPNGHKSFLIRDSQNTSSGYCIVFRDGIKLMKSKIDKDSNGKYFIESLSKKVCFESLTQLVEYRTKQAVRIQTPCIDVDISRTAGLSKVTNKVWQIQRSSLELCKKTYTGSFGEVWEAVWNNTTPVIVNTLNPGTITVSDFLKEATVMKQLRHRNVVQLYAVCVEKEPIYVVTEPMEHGNLRHYLRNDGRTLHLLQLVSMGEQVAAGMAYLEKNTCIIHGNLAARSVFLSEHLICRIGNFSAISVLSKDVSKTIPISAFSIKWSAPEVLKFCHVTTKSDVWSFGVLLYEVVTYGRFPYPGMNDDEVQDAIRTGYRMQRPTGCPEPLFKIMMKCWNSDADCRPTFETLQWQLEEFFLYAATVATPYLP